MSNGAPLHLKYILKTTLNQPRDILEEDIQIRISKSKHLQITIKCSLSTRRI